jgi:hypothetical protein
MHSVVGGQRGLNDLQRARLVALMRSVVGGQRGLNDLQRARLVALMRSVVGGQRGLNNLWRTTLFFHRMIRLYPHPPSPPLPPLFLRLPLCLSVLGNLNLRESREERVGTKPNLMTARKPGPPTL